MSLSKILTVIYVLIFCAWLVGFFRCLLLLFVFGGEE